MAKSTSKPPAESLALYAKLVATQPGVELKGASVPYTATNGNMFSMLTESGSLALRLPSPDREAFLEKYGAKLQMAYGIVRKDYVVVPDALFAKTKELARYFRISCEHTSSLPAKPTTRKKASARATKAPKKR